MARPGFMRADVWTMFRSVMKASPAEGGSQDSVKLSNLNIKIWGWSQSQMRTRHIGDVIDY